MGKRAARRRNRPQQSDNNVHELFDEKNADWHPLQGEVAEQKGQRDQSYRRNIRPKSENQAALMEAIDAFNLVLALGPAGTGKTYIAVSKAVEALDKGDIGRIVLARPAVEAGENIGFLPGDVEAKMAPYLRPLYDALNDRLGTKRLRTYLSDGTIEIAPIGYMRGRTLNNAFVVIDEAQNCTYGQLKMLVTRLGWNSTMILTGDPDQTDLLPEMSGLSEMSERLENVEDVACVQLRDKDIVRHPLVASMLTVL
ncbi:PhoH family protein [Thalassospira sp. MIT1370]|uniref:PhoH family protein n=1 Tax=Thalassospira TaxID=168934 RepID=UPI00399AE862